MSAAVVGLGVVAALAVACWLRKWYVKGCLELEEEMAKATHPLHGFKLPSQPYQQGPSEPVSPPADEWGADFRGKRMVVLDEVIARLEQGFGTGCAPVTTLLHHFDAKPENAPLQGNRPDL